MSSDKNSTNTAILAIFVLVLVAMIGFFALQFNDADKEVKLKVDLPELEQVDKSKGSN